MKVFRTTGVVHKMTGVYKFQRVQLDVLTVAESRQDAARQVAEHKGLPLIEVSRLVRTVPPPRPE